MFGSYLTIGMLKLPDDWHVEVTWRVACWSYLTSGVLKLPDEWRVEVTWWVVCWSYLTSGILKLPDEGRVEVPSRDVQALVLCSTKAELDGHNGQYQGYQPKHHKQNVVHLKTCT